MIITFLIIIVLMFTISIGILIYSKDEYDSSLDDDKKIKSSFFFSTTLYLLHLQGLCTFLWHLLFSHALQC